jgi:hypothetical protein
MAQDVPVLVACPIDRESKEHPAKAVLRINDAGLVLWYWCEHNGAAYWLRRTFRPFRGPRPVQALLTILFAPTILFGRWDVQRVAEEAGGPRLRITPFVPPEFGVDIIFGSEQDRETVAGLIERFWSPEKREEGGGLVSQFPRRWWQALAVPALLALFTLWPVTGDAGAWIGCGVFACYVVLVMVVEAVSYRLDCPPQGRPDEPVADPD